MLAKSLGLQMSLDRMYKAAIGVNELLHKFQINERRGFKTPETVKMQNYTMRWYEHGEKERLYKETAERRDMELDEERIQDYVSYAHERIAREILRFRERFDRRSIDETQEARIRKNFLRY